MKNQRTLVYILAAIVIVVAGYVMFTNRKQSVQTEQENTTAQTENEPSVATTTKTPSTAPVKKLSYEQAITTYKNRFQFSQCHGTPGLITVKKGQPVMLDNRDATSHTIKANGQTFKIGGYGYVIVYPQQITKDNVNLTLANITCDGGGSATLNVEK